MKVLEILGRYFRVPDKYQSKDEVMSQPANEVILEELEASDVMDQAQRAK